jgi:hypothetical protein
MNQVNLHISNHFLVKQSLQCQSTQQDVVKVQKNLPLVSRKTFNFKLNVNTKPPKFVVALLNVHTQYKYQHKTVASTCK